MVRMSTRDGKTPKRKRRPGTPARKRALARERQLEIAIENISQGVCMFDAAGKIVLCNRRYVEMYDMSPDVVKPGFSLIELLRHRHQIGRLRSDPEEVGRLIVQSISKGETIERLIETHNGRVTRAISIPIGGGGWVATHEDITDQRNTQASFRLLFDNNPVPMFVYAEKNLRFLAVNDAAVAHYGFSREQFLTMTALDIRPLEDREVFRKTIEGGVRNYREGSVWRHRKADGTTVEMAIFARHLNYEEKPALLVAVIDVTERNLAEARLRETHHREERRRSALPAGQPYRRALSRHEAQ